MEETNYLCHTEGGWRLFSPLSVCLFVCLWTAYHKKLWNSDEIWWRDWVCDKEENITFWWRLESGSGDRVGAKQGRLDSILVETQIWIRIQEFLNDSSPLRDGAKNDIQHDVSKSLRWVYDKTWWTSWLGDKNKRIRFWLRSGSRSGLSVGYKT